ncbi:MAG TPA: amidohydrolase family protein, partial [Candidatus Acidoferrum sp.]|nr:amidohydrolase family protein [Candidatus Acidoferrum sp.]
MNDRLVDVRISDGRIREISERASQGRGDEVIDAHGGVLLPGLHDHHIHLRALAASSSSVFVGPSEIADSTELAARLRGADHDGPNGQWIRAYGYHESVAGSLDRRALDAMVGTRPVRLQHGSGAAWILNSVALQTIGVEHWDDEGVEREPDGQPTGVLYRLDHRIAATTRDSATTPNFASIGQNAAASGITGFTDADPCRTQNDLDVIARAQSTGALPQRIHAMGPDSLTSIEDDRLTIGPVKILLGDFALPTIQNLADQIVGAHLKLRPVAIHCVTRIQLVVALAAFGEAGSVPGDRIEHGSIVPVELLRELTRLRLIVVTQPGFIAERGDGYLRDVEPHEIPNLYRCRSLLRAGIALA